MPLRLPLRFFSLIPPKGVPKCQHPAGPRIPLAQPRCVFSDCPNLPVFQVRRPPAHPAVHVMGALALAERGELRRDVFGIRASEARELRRDAGARGAVATAAGGNAMDRIAAAPK